MLTRRQALSGSVLPGFSEDDRKQQVRQQLHVMLDRYEALAGVRRAQTSRNALAVSIADLLLSDRRIRRKHEATPPPPAPRRLLPAGWKGPTRVTGHWDGFCSGCGGRAEAGHAVVWGPGRPAAWRHVSCERPYDGLKKEGAR